MDFLTLQTNNTIQSEQSGPVSAGDAKRLKCGSENRYLFSLNAATVLHNQSCGLVVDKSLREEESGLKNDAVPGQA